MWNGCLPAPKATPPSGEAGREWGLRIAELDRAGVAAKQARLWVDEHSETNILAP